MSRRSSLQNPRRPPHARHGRRSRDRGSGGLGGALLKLDPTDSTETFTPLSFTAIPTPAFPDQRAPARSTSVYSGLANPTPLTPTPLSPSCSTPSIDTSQGRLRDAGNAAAEASPSFYRFSSTPSTPTAAPPPRDHNLFSEGGLLTINGRRVPTAPARRKKGQGGVRQGGVRLEAILDRSRFSSRRHSWSSPLKTFQHVSTSPVPKRRNRGPKSTFSSAHDTFDVVERNSPTHAAARHTLTPLVAGASTAGLLKSKQGASHVRLPPVSAASRGTLDSGIQGRGISMMPPARPPGGPRMSFGQPHPDADPLHVFDLSELKRNLNHTKTPGTPDSGNFSLDGTMPMFDPSMFEPSASAIGSRCASAPAGRGRSHAQNLGAHDCEAGPFSWKRTRSPGCSRKETGASCNFDMMQTSLNGGEVEAPRTFSMRPFSAPALRPAAKLTQPYYIFGKDSHEV